MGQLGLWNGLGDSVPDSSTLVTSMSDELLVTVFLPACPTGSAHPTPCPKGSAYIFVVSKAVASTDAVVPARNVTLTFHRSVTVAEVETPGRQGATGFDLTGAGSLPTKSGPIRHGR